MVFREIREQKKKENRLHPDEWTGVDSDSHRIKAANDASWDCDLICSSDEKHEAWTKGVIIVNIAMCLGMVGPLDCRK